MALGHCRHRIHSLGWSIVMFFLIYWACIDEPWVSLVTRVQSAIKKRSNLLKNVSFTQAGLHSWAAAALPPSIINTPPAWQMGWAAAGFVPHSFRPLPPTPPDSDAGRRQAHSGCHSRLGERPDLAERLADSRLLGTVGKKKASLWSCPRVVAGTTLPVATTSTLERGHVGRAGGRGGLRSHSGPGLHLSGLPACPLPGTCIWRLQGQESLGPAAGECHGVCSFMLCWMTASAPSPTSHQSPCVDLKSGRFFLGDPLRASSSDVWVWAFRPVSSRCLHCYGHSGSLTHSGGLSRWGVCVCVCVCVCVSV